VLSGAAAPGAPLQAAAAAAAAAATVDVVMVLSCACGSGCWDGKAMGCPDFLCQEACTGVIA
jgi:hypothetical protein